ncbi:lysophospholipid acyltransferase 1 [Diachasma alloeum]|uniref:lysophospholipid acyltransferase 1 n=1 Tax=Diachasma alloeum TaxID=454923 RepID=UPI000738156C|nr:lysophospholipid acyltransferase 1 [Diachasma alloeum]
MDKVHGVAALKVSGHGFYDGSRAFEGLSDVVGLPVDQMNFVISQFTALVLAALFRTSLRPGVVSPVARHTFGLIVGLCMGYFCFGKQAVHLAGLPAICYIVMRTQDPRIVQRVVLTVALGYLSCIHFYRQMYDYGSYSLDITGPLMVITQKVISLAYSIHDGFTRREPELTSLQRHQAVKIMPTTLEYFSYVLHFQALMAGPVIFYRDYIDFIHGTKLNGTSFSGFYDDPSKHVVEIVLEPSPTQIVMKKVVASLTCAILFVVFIPIFPIQKVKDDEFLNSSMIYKIWYMMISTMMVRFKYYYAWLFADAICNNSGMGFNGLDSEGKPQWDFFSNIDVVKFETSLSLRESIEAWNKGTNNWLRMVAYERAGRYRTLFTYALSALWHGFYPGYYLTFATGALFTFASRTVRRSIRPLFLGSRNMKSFYDVLTFITTRVFMAYLTFSFVLLEFMPSVKVYISMYLIPHLLSLAAILVLPVLPLGHAHRKREVPSTNGQENSRPKVAEPEAHNGLSKKAD